MIIRTFILTALAIFLNIAVPCAGSEPGTDESSLYFYRITFTDKGNVSVGNFAPEDLLSPAAIARREKCGVAPLTAGDLPVNQDYITAVSQRGLAFKCASKWMNSALFTSASKIETDALNDLPFIIEVLPVKNPSGPAKGKTGKFGVTSPGIITDNYDPNIPVNGVPLHQSGFIGKNILIAVLDAGFINANLIESLEPLFARGGIVATHDFVNGSDYVYDYHNHGTSVLSILAGSRPDIIFGTATGARLPASSY